MVKFHNFKYLFFVILPVIAVAVWYSPILFKGYPALGISEQLVLGRNVAVTGMYAMENDLSVILSPSLIKEQGHESFLGDKWTAYLYALVFKVFGFLGLNKLILFSAFLSAAALLIFAFLVFYLFNFKTSLIFSLIYVFLPFIWQNSIQPGGYEFALFFISLFFLFYFLGRKSKYGFIPYIFSGLFLALACLARETFLLFIPIFLIYFLLKKEKQAIIFIFIPLVILFSVFYLPDFLAGRNVYSQLFPVTEPSENNDFMSYGHTYPDPYTYYFDRENFLREYENRLNSSSFITSLYLEKSAINNVEDYHLPFGHRILLSVLLTIDQAGKFISWEDVGGPLIFLLMLLGLVFLKKEKPQVFRLFVWLVGGVIFLLCFVVLVGRNHFIDFGWILALLAALGLLSLISIFEAQFGLSKKKTFFLTGFILAMVLYSLILANHSYWGRIYDNRENLMALAYSSKIDKLNISSKDVIATDGVSTPIILNYLKDKSVVVFQQGTIEKLLENGKLNPAFRNFGVTHIVGYPDDLSKKILKAVKVVNISSSDTEEAVPENYNTKNWIMNLIK